MWKIPFEGAIVLKENDSSELKAIKLRKEVLVAADLLCHQVEFV